MKILFSSHFFHPSIGGIEEVSRLLAREFVAAGHEVRLVTQTAADDGATFPFSIYRRPSPLGLVRLVRWCDVLFHNNISLRAAWPLLVVRRPWVIAHHMRMTRVAGGIGWQDRLKQFLARAAHNIAVSQSMREHLAAPSVVIGNPYDDQLFRSDPAAVRDLELVFLGRLLDDKGLDLLLETLAALRSEGLRPRLTVVGSGPAEARLRAQSAQLALDEQVNFTGMKKGAELVALLNRHQLMVVPSRAHETFGLVALEGIACGCVVVGAQSGGLPEAIGACGVTFPPGDGATLTQTIAGLLAPGANLESFRAAAPAHLARHTARAVAAEYLRALEEAVQR
jgi:glycosyltransferase involved in cell wall biosynthesis